MNFFPIPYQDELLYSVLARYSMRSGNVKEIHNFEDLFGTRNCIASMELPTQIDALIENMPAKTKYTAEYFICNHTLFPFYAAFIQQGRGEKIIQSMKNGEGAISYIRMGLISSSVTLNQYFRFCPKCLKEDIETFGESYWHRLHQVTGVFVCPKHRVPLYNSSVLIRGGNRQRYINTSLDNCKLEKEVSYLDEQMEKMLWMAEDVADLLNNRFGHREQKWFKNQFRVNLVEKGYARMNNYIHQKKLKQDFVDFYGEEYLNRIQSTVSLNGACWLSSMVQINDRTTYAIRYLLLARFLGITLDELFNKRNCIYEDGIEDKVASVEEYQELWDQRLIELTQTGLSIREIAKILKSSTKTIRKSADRLGIEPFWKFNGGGKYLNVKYTDTEEFKLKKEEYRSKWTELHNQHPDKSSNQIRKENDGMYAWLKKYDYKWLEQNYRKIKRAANTVDWNKRDNELLPQVKKVVEEMREGKPERVTWTSIGSKLGVSGWLSKRRDKLPLTKAYIESVEESLRDFQVRKVIWAIDELENQGTSLTKYNILETSGVKTKYINSISDRIYKILVSRGYEDNLLL